MLFFASSEVELLHAEQNGLAARFVVFAKKGVKCEGQEGEPLARGVVVTHNTEFVVAGQEGGLRCEWIALSSALGREEAWCVD